MFEVGYVGIPLNTFHKDRHCKMFGSYSSRLGFVTFSSRNLSLKLIHLQIQLSIKQKPYIMLLASSKNAKHMRLKAHVLLICLGWLG